MVKFAKTYSKELEQVTEDSCMEDKISKITRLHVNLPKTYSPNDGFDGLMAGAKEVAKHIKHEIQ